MKNMRTRLFSLLLVFALVASMLPTAFAVSSPVEIIELTEDAYASADAVFAQIDAMEAEPARKNASQTDKTDAAEALVKQSDSYVEGSLERNGDAFTWWTEDGIRCSYNPYMRKKQEEMVAPQDPQPAGIYNEPAVTKGGWPSSSEVYLIGPYYGVDDSFTNQYKNEAAAIANALGDTDGYTLYSGSAATVDKVAEAISKGAVVIFDSHGSTDYVDPNANLYDDVEDDFVTGANYSYLCLTNKSGLTTQDYNDGAAYSSDGDAFINGDVIANHMTSNSPAGLLWMAICLGMATDTICMPMREKGVEVVYGYSQSVTFGGDYCFEEVFWDNMCEGTDVATAVSAMKSRYGQWDQSSAICSACGWSGAFTTIAAARSNYAAFPIVVSDEDAHPGQRNTSGFYGADSLQTVQSTYTLYSQYEVTAVSSNTAYGTVSVNGSTITATPAEGYFAESYTILSGAATVTQNGNTFSVMAQSDCQIQVNFAPKTVVTVQFSGANLSGQNGYAGDPMALPTVTAPEGYQFLGWMSAPLGSDTTDKPAFYTDSFIPAGSVTLYALYSYVQENSGTGTGDYVKVTDDPADWSGEYVIVYEAGSYIMDGSLNTFDAKGNVQSVTITDGVIPAAQGDAYKFTVTAVSGGYAFQGTSGKYMGHTASGSNNIATAAQALVNTLSVSADGSVTVNGSGGGYLRYNASDNRFRYYKPSSYASQKAIALYVKDGSAGITYYTGNPVKCEHTNTIFVAEVPAACTANGYTAGVLCTDCSSYVSGHEVIAALGHSWGEWAETTAPTCTDTGIHTQTCGRCGETNTQTVSALGHSWGDWEETIDPTCTEEGLGVHSCSVCGETETEIIAALGHSYEAAVTAPTTTTPGYTTHTCGICGDHYQDSYTYMLSFATPAGVTAVESLICPDGGTISLPSAGVPSGDKDYVFVGWINTKLEATTEKPDVYPTGAVCTVADCGTLYALYSYVEAGESTGTGDYIKVTEAPDDWSGEYLIVYETGSLIFDGSLSKLDAVNDYQSVTVTDSTIAAAQGDAYKFTVAAMTGGYSIQSISGKYIGRAANSNGLDEGTAAVKNTISLNADGTVNIVGAGGAYLRFNATTNQMRFRYYKSSSYTSQKAISLYRKDGSSGTVYYTTCSTETAKISSAGVTLSGALGISFNTDASADYTMQVTVGSAEPMTVTSESGVFTVNVYAEDMMQIINAKLYNANGEMVSEANFSLINYVAAVQAMDVSEEIKTLAAATLTYCQYAAKVQGKYSGETNAMEEIPSGAFTDFRFPTGGPQGVSAFANLKEACGLFLRLPESYRQGYTFTVDGQAVELTQSGESYVFGIGGIQPENYDKVYTFVIWQGETQVYSYELSVMSYLGACLGRNLVKDDNVKDLMTAMYHYYMAAEACAASA